MNKRWDSIYKKAVTVKKIGGIPIGTKFEVVVNSLPGMKYSLCRGLSVKQLWNDQFKIIGD